MATFFDTEEQSDINLLHRDVRGHEELDRVINQVEDRIINFYSERPSIERVLMTGKENLSTTNEVEVRLLDYDQDTPANSPAELKTALKQAIAFVAEWWLRNYDNPTGASSIKQGKRSISFEGGLPHYRDWPNGWQSWLKNYDNRETNWAI